MQLPPIHYAGEMGKQHWGCSTYKLLINFSISSLRPKHSVQAPLIDRNTYTQQDLQSNIGVLVFGCESGRINRSGISSPVLRCIGHRGAWQSADAEKTSEKKEVSFSCRDPSRLYFSPSGSSSMLEPMLEPPEYVLLGGHSHWD